ncbi:MAG: hypothetical protein JSV27_10235 [Candidatus Bathyarchaeota archaeon]|nr:MAG: hypothetical protein JSV27_10235 [Candidatus Bathyarchaeota archaeon]
MVVLSQSIPMEVPEGFDLWVTISSSSWSELAPFGMDVEEKTLTRVHRLRSGRVVRLTLSQGVRGTLVVHVESLVELDEPDLREIEDTVEGILMLDEDRSFLYALLEGYPVYGWVREVGAGRSVRSPTVFEDVVKTICTTNASWGLTMGITKRLCEKLGDPFSDGLSTFPTPLQVATSTEEFLRREVKSGYRSPYLIELATSIADGELDVEAWKTSPEDSFSLKQTVKAVKGVGNLSADNILKLLGRHDFLALEDWSMGRFAEIHGKGGEVSDEEIKAFYEPFGDWRGLVMSLDLTKEHIMNQGLKR